MTERSCSIDGCDNTRRARGWCGRHYQSWKAHGDPTGSRSYHRTAEEAWAARTERRGGCLLWTGPVNPKGYGVIRDNGRRVGVHRYAWEREHGPIPENMKIDHRYHCDHRCVEVGHLRTATNAENVSHMKGAHSDSSTGVRNVDIYRGKYRVQVRHRGVTHYRHPIDTLEEAAAIAAELRAQLFGSFAGRG